MPSATPELQEKMRQRFGSIDSEGPEQFLSSAGYTLTPHWLWIAKPGVSTLDEMTEEEFDCLAFLIQEWDYGSLECLTDPIKSSA